jgi:hypothetical protein
MFAIHHTAMHTNRPPHRFLIPALLLALVWLLPPGAGAQTPWNTQNKMRDTAMFIRQSTSMRLMMNSNGLLGADAFPWDSLKQFYNPRWLDGFQYPAQVGLEYPVGSSMEHLRVAGLWVGAIVRTPTGYRQVVTTTMAPGFVTETLGHILPSDSFYTATIDDKQAPWQRNFDDDGDGRVDEDQPDGIDNDGDWDINGDDLNHNRLPDHGEPHVDEDGAAISEHDLYVTYRDSFPRPKIIAHYPLELRIWQKSYSWTRLVREPILPFEYEIVYRGSRTLDSVYLGFYTKLFLGPYYPVNVLAVRSVNRKYILGFDPPTQTMFAAAILLTGVSPPPLGVTLLGTSKPLSSLKISYRRLLGIQNLSDPVKYRLMSSGIVENDTTTPNTMSYPEQILSVGPFLSVQPGDTLRFSIALVSGDVLSMGYSNVMDNAHKALELYNRNFRPANYPPSPPLRVTPLANGVKVDWTWRPGDSGADPLETWDDYNKYVLALPDTHWRKRNPPPGKITGGRIFEAFRLWRSEYPLFKEENLSLIRQFDVDDNLGFEGQTGLQFTYLDTPLVRGRKYWYSVTSVSIPDYFVSLDTGAGGSLVFDTTQSEPFESSLFENVRNFTPGFIPSSRVGEVKVVPNPYRTDQDYVYENGGYEGLARLWTEFRRSVWFIHLPPKCKIRIFTMVGEVVKVIDHDDDNRASLGYPTGVEEFPLYSESNRTLASGIYIYIVESDLGTQTGKFVVIR